ncbi:hypothetical protein [Cupriavidus sp. D384]|uniref:HNH endonuclease n=1 Tax=Cupriavidus sp. D384 TaxID=1538095 RepID=UPI00082DF619|nr:hypothetical protein [Cupriavidus sp. D384]
MAKMDRATDESFTAFLREKAAEAKRDTGYPPNQFIKMLNADGGYATASRLLAAKNPSDGFVALSTKHRLDLTVEALVLETKWIAYFDDLLLKEAERKLKGANYKFVRYQIVDSNRWPVDVLEKVTAEHLFEAVRQFREGTAQHVFAPSTDYDLLTEDGRRFPPKAVFGVALSMALGGETVEPKHFSGGESSACFRILREAGYAVVPKDSVEPSQPETDPDKEWHEGKPRLVSHLKRERAAGLSKAKKAQFRRLHGALRCERCGFDPAKHYDEEHAESCIEVHHAETHVSKMESGHVTTLDDVQCLCANCHRVVHSMLREEARRQK